MLTWNVNSTSTLLPIQVGFLCYDSDQTDINNYQQLLQHRYLAQYTTRRILKGKKKKRKGERGKLTS